MKNCTLFFFAALFTAISFAQTPTDKIILTKGQKFSTATTANGTTSMELMGQNIETVNEMSRTGTIEVKDVTPAGYKLTSTVTKMKIKSKGGPTGELNVDSEKKEDMNSPMGQVFKEQLQPHDAEITMLGKAVAANATGENDMQKIMQSVMNGGSNGDDVSAIFILVPAGKKPGDTWTDSLNADGVKVNNLYTLTQLNGNEAVVTVNTSSNINKSLNAQGAELTIIIDSKVASTNIVDITTGLVKEKKTTVEGKGSIGAGGQEMPMSTKASSTTTIKSM